MYFSTSTASFHIHPSISDWISIHCVTFVNQNPWVFNNIFNRQLYPERDLDVKPKHNSACSQAKQMAKRDLMHVGSVSPPVISFYSKPLQNTSCLCINITKGALVYSYVTYQSSCVFVQFRGIFYSIWHWCCFSLCNVTWFILLDSTQVLGQHKSLVCHRTEKLNKDVSIFTHIFLQCFYESTYKEPVIKCTSAMISTLILLN